MLRVFEAGCKRIVTTFAPSRLDANLVKTFRFRGEEPYVMEDACITCRGEVAYAVKDAGISC